MAAGRVGHQGQLWSSAVGRRDSPAVDKGGRAGMPWDGKGKVLRVSSSQLLGLGHF